MTYRILAVLAVAILGGCKESPLYDTARVPGGTRDEVPRDGNGEPMLASIRPVPSTAMLGTPPAAPISAPPPAPRAD